MMFLLGYIAAPPTMTVLSLIGCAIVGTVAKLGICFAMLGLFGLGRSKKEARIAADLAEAAIATITDAEAVGRFEPLPEADLFDVEYWSLEQAKLGSANEAPLAGQIAAITGAAGAIGFATAKAFAAAGAEVALLDIDEAAVEAKAKAIGGAALGIRCDVTDAGSVRDAFAQVAAAFGGLDTQVVGPKNCLSSKEVFQWFYFTEIFAPRRSLPLSPNASWRSGSARSSVSPRWPALNPGSPRRRS